MTPADPLDLDLARPGTARPGAEPGRAEQGHAEAGQEIELGRWVELAQKGDEDAFRALYRDLQPGLLRYLRVLVGEEAEDVASEAWSQVARDLTTFRGDGPGFRGWVTTIGRHRALDHLRYHRRRPVAPADELPDRIAADDTAGRVLETLDTERAIALIAALPRDQAEVILLRVVMGLDVQTTATVLGKRSGAVRTAAHRGLRRLSEWLREGPSAGAPS